MVGCWACLCRSRVCQEERAVFGLEGAGMLPVPVQLLVAIAGSIVHCGPFAWRCRGPAQGFVGWQLLASQLFCWLRSAVWQLFVLQHATMPNAGPPASAVAVRRSPNHD